ncbi:MAG: beta-N-acetylhexosaminidase, partial [Deltaproteobacteria bacterium]|nr:beta-N-acetylhexosaminidase [Deltaproteobacteria bacterium]
MIVGKGIVASPLWVGFEGKTLPPDLAVWLAKGSVSGVVLFARNIDSPAQVRALCREIRAAAGPGHPAPLIAVDQE